MPQHLIYFVAVPIIIFIAGFIYAQKAAAKYRNAAGSNFNRSAQSSASAAPSNGGVYERKDAERYSSHPLGAVQEVIRGRVRFALFGLTVVCVALFGLYAVQIARMELNELTVTETHRLITTVILAASVIYGLRIISFITYRVKLRRLGFEICSVFGVKAYAYKDVDFFLFDKWENKYAGDGYRPAVMKTETHNRVWVCQVIFKDGSRPLELKSSRYAWLYDKTRRLIDELYKKEEK